MREESSISKKVYQAALTSLAIGSLSIGLIVGLSFIGVIERFDEALWRTAKDQGMDLTHRLPVWVRWTCTVASTYALAWSLMQVEKGWRQWLLFCTTVIVVAGWAPVLVMASYYPQISGTLAAIIWCGICAIVYSGKPDHRTVANLSTSIPPGKS